MERVRDADDGRPDPEQVLRDVTAQERRRTRGRLKIYLGYTSGVGKSFRMLDEGRRRRERGQDVLVGAVQSPQPSEVQRVLDALEVIPLKRLPGGDTMDVEVILRRRPQVCIVDGLAFDNPEGSKHRHRWQDVEELLAAGVTVIASVNLQHIEERRDEVEAITGRRAAEVIPESFVAGADGIIVVDVTPEVLRRRTPDGRSAHGDAAEAERQWSRLRELALLLAAQVVDRQLQEYLAQHGIDAVWGSQERILVCITPRANARAMIAAARRAADRFHAELWVLYVRQPNLGAADRAALDQHLALAREARARIELVDGDHPTAAILAFARARGITQIFIGHSFREGWRDSLFGGPVDRLIAEAEGIDVRVFPH